MKSQKFFRTNIKFIDNFGGIPLNEITEICGAAGAGKTKLMHQLTVSYISAVNNSLVYYYDIDNTFDYKYILRICEKINDCDRSAILDRILIQKHLDVTQLNKSLKEIMKNTKSRNCLIVIDSVPNLFINELLFESPDNWPIEQLKLIVLLGETLVRITKTCTILVSNQVRSDVRTAIEKEKTNLLDFDFIPALGSIWEEFVDNRFLIRKIKRDLRLLIVSFSSSFPETFGLVKFRNELFI